MKLAERVFKRNDYYITSPYGARIPIKTPNGTSSKMHRGTDYGTHGKPFPQYAIENGVVLRASVDQYGAIYCVVYYPRINKTLQHWHLAKCYVKTGQKVNRSTILGLTGATGRATGVHLHLGLRDGQNGAYMDPESYDYKEPIIDIPKKTKIVAKYPAKYFDRRASGSFKTTANLHIRDNAGTSYKVLGLLPQATGCRCYGYYSTDDKRKPWLFVVANVNGVKYEGFCHSAYLRRP